MVPFRRNEEFVGRGYVLEQLEKILTARRDYQPRVALWGFGGVGLADLFPLKEEKKYSNIE